jgi:hypothetical protein
MSHTPGMQTLDAWDITTIEQDGGFKGQEIGRVWLKDPAPLTLGAAVQPWSWLHCGTVADARALAREATTMTYAGVVAAWERRYPARQRLSWRPLPP